MQLQIHMSKCLPQISIWKSMKHLKLTISKTNLILPLKFTSFTVFPSLWVASPSFKLACPKLWFHLWLPLFLYDIDIPLENSSRIQSLLFTQLLWLWFEPCHVLLPLWSSWSSNHYALFGPLQQPPNLYPCSNTDHLQLLLTKQTESS